MRMVKLITFLIILYSFSGETFACTENYENRMNRMPFNDLFLVAMKESDAIFIGEFFTSYGNYDPKSVFNMESGFVFIVDKIIKGNIPAYVQGPFSGFCGFSRLVASFKSHAIGDERLKLGDKYLIIGNLSDQGFFFKGIKSLSDSENILLRYEFNKRIEE